MHVVLLKESPAVMVMLLHSISSRSGTQVPLLEQTATCLSFGMNPSLQLNIIVTEVLDILLPESILISSKVLGMRHSPEIISQCNSNS